MVIKKLIAISVVFALVAGAAFAVDLGGDIIAGATVVSKQGGGDAEVFGGALGRIRLEGSGEAEIGIGTIGGWVRFEKSGITDRTAGSYNSWEDPEVPVVSAYGLAWWQPIEQLRIQLGANPDGMYDTSHIGRYGFYAQANELGLVNSDGNWDATASFDNGVYGGGMKAEHFALIITPMDGVTINVALPFNADPGATGDTQIAAAFKGALFQVNYAADFGAIHITYEGAGSSLTDTGKFWGSAYLGSLVEGLQLEFGVGFAAVKSPAPKKPLSIALAARYDVSEQFGVKLRSIFDIPMQSGGKVAVRVNVLPFYAVNESVTAYFDIGMCLPGTANTFAWHFNPYVRVGAEWGSGFYAGLAINNGSGASGSKVNFGVPIGIIAKF